MKAQVVLIILNCAIEGGERVHSKPKGMTNRTEGSLSYVELIVQLKFMAAV